MTGAADPIRHSAAETARGFDGHTPDAGILSSDMTIRLLADDVFNWMAGNTLKQSKRSHNAEVRAVKMTVVRSLIECDLWSKRQIMIAVGSYPRGSLMFEGENKVSKRARELFMTALKLLRYHYRLPPAAVPMLDRLIDANTPE